MYIYISLICFGVKKNIFSNQSKPNCLRVSWLPRVDDWNVLVLHLNTVLQTAGCAFLKSYRFYLEGVNLSISTFLSFQYWANKCEGRGKKAARCSVCTAVYRIHCWACWQKYIFYLNFDEMLNQSRCKVLWRQAWWGALVPSTCPGVNRGPKLLSRHDDEAGAVGDQLEILLLVHLSAVLLQDSVDLLVLWVAEALLPCRHRISVWRTEEVR